MTHRLLAAAASIALVVAGHPASAQVRAVNPAQPAQPVTPALHQPTNLELQMQINALGETVAQLSDRLAALNQHIASLSGQLGTLNAREGQHFKKIYATSYQACKLLYQHHWAPSGANPTPGNPYVPDDYCRADAWQASLGD